MSYLWLLPTVSMASDGESLLLRKGKTLVKIAKIGQELLALLEKLDGNTPESTLSDDSLFQILRTFLDQRGWLVRLAKPAQYYQENHLVYTRQLSYFAHCCRDYPDLILTKLQKSSVAILGMGGIGSIVAHNLAGAGVGKFLLVDSDQVEESNLNRQLLYCRHHIGSYKSEVAAAILKEKFPDADFQSLVADLNKTKPTFNSDLIIIAGECDGLYDHPEVIGDRSVIRAGYDGEMGQIGPLLCKERGSPTWQDIIESQGQRQRFKRLFASERRLSCSWNSSGSTINTTVAGLLAEECLKFLAPQLGEPTTLGKEMLIDMTTSQISLRSLFPEKVNALADGERHG